MTRQTPTQGRTVFEVLRHHWPEYLMEAAGLGLFMISAGAVTTLFEYPGSPINHWIGSAFVRRSLIGLAMGVTAIGLIYSPWGQQSGAHLNPAVTLTFPAGKEASVTVRSEKKTDVHLFVFDASGKEVAKDDSPGPSCDLKFTPKEAGKYTLEVRNLGPGDNQSTVKVVLGK